MSSPAHLRYFLANVKSPAWLEVLGAIGVLDLPDTDGPWPSHAAVARLAERYPGEVAAWLQDMYQSHGTRPVPRRRSAVLHSEPVGQPSAWFWLL